MLLDLGRIRSEKLPRSGLVQQNSSGGIHGVTGCAGPYVLGQADSAYRIVETQLERLANTPRRLNSF